MRVTNVSSKDLDTDKGAMITFRKGAMITAQKMKFSIKDFFSNLVTFTEEILN